MKNLKEGNNNILLGLNDLILKLTEELNSKNYIEVIIYLQKNHIDTNNSYIDQIINENDDEKKLELISKLNDNNSVDMISSGYVAQLFSVFNNNKYFCFEESKTSECIICQNKKIEIIKELKPFVYVNINNINESDLFNIILTKYKENNIYDCECRKNSKEDVLCTKVKYNLESYPIYMTVIFDMSYSDIYKYKEKIYKITEDYVVLNLNKEYKLKGIISLPSYNHYCSIIFNPTGKYINEYFQPNYIYYYDGMQNDGKIVRIKEGEDWRKLGIPYILNYILVNN